MHFLGLLNQDIWDVQLAIPDAEAQLVKKKINYYLSRLLTQIKMHTWSRASRGDVQEMRWFSSPTCLTGQVYLLFHA